MNHETILKTLDSISGKAHALSTPSNPARPEERTKIEKVALLVACLSDIVRAAFDPPIQEDDNGRPALSD